MSQQPVIIIKRRKKGEEHGHHGGAWKVAYADFVTAMMAFFLLLWLLNITTKEQRDGIADYFAPASPSPSKSGADGVLGGTTFNIEQTKVSSGTPPGVSANVSTSDGAAGNKEDELSGEDGELDNSSPEAIKREEENFEKIEMMLKQAILASPELKGLAENIVIEITPEGLRIQIVDRDRYSLFPSGSSVLYERGRELLRLTGKVISRLPNKISVSGHTDSSPFAAGSRRDNWTLSVERADASRVELMASGVANERLSRVVGLADRDPFDLNNPRSPPNRRISIILLRRSLAKNQPLTDNKQPTGTASPSKYR